MGDCEVTGWGALPGGCGPAGQGGCGAPLASIADEALNESVAGRGELKVLLF